MGIIQPSCPSAQAKQEDEAATSAALTARGMLPLLPGLGMSGENDGVKDPQLPGSVSFPVRDEPVVTSAGPSPAATR